MAVPYFLYIPLYINIYLMLNLFLLDYDIYKCNDVPYIFQLLRILIGAHCDSKVTIF